MTQNSAPVSLGLAECFASDHDVENECRSSCDHLVRHELSDGSQSRAALMRRAGGGGRLLHRWRRRRGCTERGKGRQRGGLWVHKASEASTPSACSATAGPCCVGVIACRGAPMRPGQQQRRVQEQGARNAVERRGGARGSLACVSLCWSPPSAVRCCVTVLRLRDLAAAARQSGATALHTQRTNALRINNNQQLQRQLQRIVARIGPAHPRSGCLRS